jgi:hypothetical protein
VTMCRIDAFHDRILFIRVGVAAPHTDPSANELKRADNSGI